MTNALLTRTAAPLLGLATLAAFALAAAPASAQTPAKTTINFNNLTTNSNGYSPVSNPYSQQGFTFSAGNGGSFYAYGGNTAQGDGETSLANNGGTTTTLTQDNTQTFSFNAIDLGPFQGNSVNPTFNNGTTVFTGIQAGGTKVTATATTNNNGKFQTFNFSGFDNLMSLTMQTQTGRTLFDNVVVTPNAPPAAVPEASTSLGFGVLLALGAAGVALRTRKRATA